MASTRKIVIGNWKMHGSREMVHALAPEVCRAAAPHIHLEAVLCPPAVWIGEAAGAVKGSRVRLGAQDCHVKAEGPCTGDIAASMLREAGCEYVIVGHSERRAAYGETDAQVRQKALQALAVGLIPVICVGETLEQREAGHHLETVGRQVKDCLPSDMEHGYFLFAYEPVWAIGTGRTPTAADIREMHAHIAQCCQRAGLAKGEGIPILYGGSVKGANARGIMEIPGVSGVLVGGASLNAAEFIAIMESAAAAAEGV
jgi:triosephosphate isomerase